MKTLTLSLDDLRVEGFSTLASEDPREDAAAAATLACTEKRSCGHICP